MIERKRRKNKNIGTINVYESHIRNHILPFAGNRIARTLHRRDSTAFLDILIDKPSLKSSHTVIQVFKTWRILMNYMSDEDVLLPSNIVSRIELPEVQNRVSFALSPEQVVALAAAMREVEPRYEAMVWIGACAGLRVGEALGLRTSNVDLLANHIEVKEQRQRGRAVKLKTKASYATLPVDHLLIERLSAHIAWFSGPAPVSARTIRRRQAVEDWDPADDDLVVTNGRGRPVKYGEFNRKWRAAVKLAGLPEGTRFHDLKHFYTTQLGSCHEHDPKTVQALSRHAEFSETWNTYAHPPVAVEGVKVTAFSKLFKPVQKQGLEDCGKIPTSISMTVTGTAGESMLA